MLGLPDPATEDTGAAVLPMAPVLLLVEGALVVAVTIAWNPMLSGPEITPPPPLFTGAETLPPPLEQALVAKVRSLP